ncbi:MAG: hypothetical protein QW416_09315, partial [Candidatus Nitrosocaldaceae archaeon]
PAGVCGGFLTFISIKPFKTFRWDFFWIFHRKPKAPIGRTSHTNGGGGEIGITGGFPRVSGDFL